MRFVIWAAVSSLPQAKKVSLDDQIEEAQRHIARHDGEVVAILRVPGKSRNIILFEDACARIDAYAELRTLIDQRAFDVLVYLDRSRLGRKASLSMAIVELCHDAGIQTYEMESPPASLRPEHSHDDMLIGAIKSVGAQQEIEKLRDRHRRGIAGRVRSGKFAGHIPYGYRLVYDTDGNQQYVVDEEEARLLRIALIDLYLGESLSRENVAEEMNRRGYKQRGGAAWTEHHMRHMIRNAMQTAGKVEINRRSKTGRTYILAEGNHDAILTEEEAQRISEESGKRMRWGRRAIQTHLFSGVLRCGRCGSPMHAHKSVPSKNTFAYHCAYDGCAGMRIWESTLVEVVETAIGYLADKAYREEVLASQTSITTLDATDEANGIKGQIDAIDAALRRLLRLYVDLGAIEESEFIAQRERLQGERLGLLGELAEIEEEVNEAEEAARLGERLVEISEIGRRTLHADPRIANAWLRRHFVITVEGKDSFQIEYL